MKFVSKISMLLVLLGGLFFLGSANSQATDVWVAQNSNGVDIYLMDDTIRYGSSRTGRWFSVSTKSVLNGELIKITTTRYSKYKSDMWRYYVQPMNSAHEAILYPRSPVFEYAMNQLGWSYSAQGSYYY
ncbi:hypothetical protein [Veillonella sp.]